ncbi:MAG: flavin reductase family protein [Mesorhizobium sp.]
MSEQDAAPLGDAIPSIDSAQFWRALGGRATGAAVVATGDSGNRAGFFALSATHLTQNPPTIMVTVGNSTSALAVLKRKGAFSVNYLADGQQELIDVFSGKAGKDGEARFESADWSVMTSGAPVLTSAAGMLDCQLVELIERYDATIAIGRIVGFSGSQEASPLVFHMGKAKVLGA